MSKRELVDGNCDGQGQKVNAYELLMAALSTYVLIALFIERVVVVAPKTTELLRIIDVAVCAVFLGDFFVQLLTVPDKKKYLRWGWVDLISSIPTLPMFRWGRLVRVVRVLRVLRGIRATKILTSVVFAHRANGAVATALFACLIFVTFGSVAILHVETDQSSNIRTPGDALWWSLATVATAGNADKYPVTAEGRAIGIALMLSGICLFGTFTGYLATWFMEPADRSNDSLANISSEMYALRNEIQELRALIALTAPGVSVAKVYESGAPAKSSTSLGGDT